MSTSNGNFLNHLLSSTDNPVASAIEASETSKLSTGEINYCTSEFLGEFLRDLNIIPCDFHKESKPTCIHQQLRTLWMFLGPFSVNWFKPMWLSTYLLHIISCILKL